VQSLSAVARDAGIAAPPPRRRARRHALRAIRARSFSVAAASVSTLPAGAARLRSFVRSLPMRLVFTRAGSGAFIARARFGVLAGVPRPR